jgi:hypothetical protein
LLRRDSTRHPQDSARISHSGQARRTHGRRDEPPHGAVRHGACQG